MDPAQLSSPLGTARSDPRNPGQLGYFPYRTAGGLASLLDALAEQPSPDQAANRAEVILTIKHRTRLAALRVQDIQQWEEHWVIADLIGTGGHIQQAEGCIGNERVRVVLQSVQFAVSEARFIKVSSEQ